jgi:hypothetical protein
VDPGLAASVLLTVADGVLARRVSDPDHDRDALSQTVRQMIRAFLDGDLAGQDESGRGGPSA